MNPKIIDGLRHFLGAYAMGVVQSCSFAENVKRVADFRTERVHVQVM
ncbi:hypothetical protein [Peribacillus simplex]